MAEMICGIVTKIFFYKEDWASFIVSEKIQTVLGTSYESYRVAGKLQGLHIKENMEVEINAEKSYHPQYGPQYKVITIRQPVPQNIEGIKAYLSSKVIKGIGATTAEKIVNRFGTDTMRVIQESPELLLEIPRVTQKQVDALVMYQANSKLYEKIFNLTKGVISLGEAQKICEKYDGEKALEILEKNPYQICEDVDGIGFLKADRIARGCGIQEDSPVRMEAAVKFALLQIAMAEGHCYVTVEDMETEAINVLVPFPTETNGIRGLQKKLTEAWKDWSAQKTAIFEKYNLEPDVIKKLEAWQQKREKLVTPMADAILDLVDKKQVIMDNEYIAASSLYWAEFKIAETALKMKNQKPLCTDRTIVEQFIQSYENQNNMKLAPEQKEAVIYSVTHRISYITGGPGRGKTTIIKVIMEFWKQYVKNDVILLAPTGRAAQRIKESLAGNDEDAYTIHKMTGIPYGEPMRDVYNTTLVICDESSMIDVQLGRTLFEFAYAGSLILVGDAKQLPPVGPGNMFKDIIRSGNIGGTKLITCYRNAGLIARNSDIIDSGSSKLLRGADFHIHYMDREKMVGAMVKEYMDLVKNGVSIRDICVVSLQRVRGATNVKALNEAIQNAYNPQDENTKTYEQFRLGDRVMQMKNNYEMEYRKKDIKGAGVFNGDLGIVTNISDDTGMMEVTFDDGRVAEYGKEDCIDLELAYAMTAHKVQGSEFKYVLCSICKDQYTLLFRAIVYTIITRAKVRLSGYFEQQALWKAVHDNKEDCRNTRLTEFLQKQEMKLLAS